MTAHRLSLESPASRSRIVVAAHKPCSGCGRSWNECGGGWLDLTHDGPATTWTCDGCTILDTRPVPLEGVCAACGAPSGPYAIHRDGIGDGPEMPLCAGCGAGPTPTCEQLWALWRGVDDNDR